MIGYNIGIDLGTANTLIFIKGKGIALKESSLVSVDTKENKIVSIGDKSKEYLGNEKDDIVCIFPIKDGVISNFDVTTVMLSDFIKKVTSKSLNKKPGVVISIPSGITEVEKRALKESIKKIGVKKVLIIDSSIAAAIGAGIEILQNTASMVVDMGGGTSEVAVISMGEVVHHTSNRIGGDSLDYSIINYIKLKYNIIIGKGVAEDIKTKIGSVYDFQDNTVIQVKGRDLKINLPKIVEISSDEIREAIGYNVDRILDLISLTFENTPVELVDDIKTSGIILTGGTALLKGLDRLISEKFNIKVIICENPIESVISGAGKVLENMRELDNVLSDEEYTVYNNL